MTALGPSVVLPILAAIAVQALVSLALHAWGRWVARRRGSGWWTRAAWLPLIALLLSIVGMAASSLLLIGAFRAVAEVDTAHKAQRLAESISNAMNVTALLVVPSWAMYIVSIVLSIIGSVMRPAKTDQTSGQRGDAA